MTMMIRRDIPTTSSPGELANDLLRVAAVPFVHDIARRFGLRVQVGILGMNMASLVIVSSPSEVPFGANAHVSALGRVLLAGLPADELGRLLHDVELVALTPHTIADKGRLRARIEQIRNQGHEIDDREFDLHLRCVAVPIRDYRKTVVAAISGSGRPAALDRTRQLELRLALEDAADGIGAQLQPIAASAVLT